MGILLSPPPSSFFFFHVPAPLLALPDSTNPLPAPPLPLLPNSSPPHQVLFQSIPFLSFRNFFSFFFPPRKPSSRGFSERLLFRLWGGGEKGFVVVGCARDGWDLGNGGRKVVSLGSGGGRGVEWVEK